MTSKKLRNHAYGMHCKASSVSKYFCRTPCGTCIVIHAQWRLSTRLIFKYCMMPVGRFEYSFISLIQRARTNSSSLVISSATDSIETEVSGFTLQAEDDGSPPAMHSLSLSTLGHWRCLYDSRVMIIFINAIWCPCWNHALEQPFQWFSVCLFMACPLLLC